MGDEFEIIKCICGQKNRRPLKVAKPGEFRCGKCGSPLLWVVSPEQHAKAATASAWKAPLLLLAVVALLGTASYFVNRSSDPKAASQPQAMPASNPPSPTPTPVVQRTPVPLPTLASPVTPIIPAATLEMLTGVRTPAPTPRAPESRELDMIVPAPGCIEKFPSYDSAHNFCKTSDEQICAGRPLCSFRAASASASKLRSQPRCLPKSGTYVPTPDIDPETVPRPGIQPLYLNFPDPILSVDSSAMLARADRFAVNRDFTRAIAEYTRLLRDQSDLPQALSGRAIAYELAGEREKAVADYCRVLIAGASRSRKASARERIAQLTGQVPAGGSNSAAPVVQRKIEPPPVTGDLTRRNRKNTIAPFKIETEAGANYLIKLVNAADPKDQVLIYVRGGETYSTKMHLGKFHFRAATGDTWYGRADLFGPSTAFFRLQQKDSARDNELQLLKFYRDGNKVSGMTISLRKVIDGNLQQESMTRSAFDAE